MSEKNLLAEWVAMNMYDATFPQRIGTKETINGWHSRKAEVKRLLFGQTQSTNNSEMKEK